MAVAAPARRSAPAPAPSRTAPPPKKTAAPARRAPTPRGRAAAATAPAPARRAPARPAPRRAPARAKPKRSRPTGQLIPLAVGRTAVAVGQLPDSGLIVRMTRGRTWIGVLGVLLVGIVALNVVTLSFAASSGKVAASITALEKENGVLGGRDATRSSTDRIRNKAAAMGLSMPTSEEPLVVTAGPQDVATAAARLAAAGG